MGILLNSGMGRFVGAEYSDHVAAIGADHLADQVVVFTGKKNRQRGVFLGLAETPKRDHLEQAVLFLFAGPRQVGLERRRVHTAAGYSVDENVGSGPVVG